MGGGRGRGSGDGTTDLPLWRRTPCHEAKEAVQVVQHLAALGVWEGGDGGGGGEEGKGGGESWN